ncbi:RusA family crossover junction endodeoxyribonuclease [Spirillospora sp. NPDC050679]
MAAFVDAEDGGPVGGEQWLRRDIETVEVVARFTVDGEPVSKGRPRSSGKGGTYTLDKTVAAAFPSMYPGWRLDTESVFGGAAVFYCWSGGRRDADNLVKLVLDGLNKVLWRDDAQVIKESGRIARRTDRASGVPAAPVGAKRRRPPRCQRGGRRGVGGRRAR